MNEEAILRATDRLMAMGGTHRKRAFTWGLLAAAVLSVVPWSVLQAAPASRPPNIVLILADDLGYGDVSCYGAAKVQTPNVDRLAKEGLRFTDAHASSATCTPSRYALLTGEYPWRRKGTGVLPGDASLIIEPGRTTLPSILQKAGYRTAVVGKWHLGLGPRGGPDWNGPIRPGPLEVGFDYGFILPATGDRVPCVYVEDHRVVGLDPNDPIQVSFSRPVGDEPTGRARPDLLKMHPSHGHDQTLINAISRIGYMAGGKAARWVDEDMADILTRKATEFIEQNKDRPFFLYFATHDIHVPRVPHPRFAGRSGMGPRGDVILQFDWCAGQILRTLDRLHLADNTLVILSSDNGPVVDDGYKDQAVERLGDHRPAGPLRGGKYSIFEGGTRVPFIVRWPGRVKPGVSGALVCQIDLLASLAAMTGQGLAPEDGPDSLNVLPALLGESTMGRDHVVEHAGALAIRQGTWKYIEPGQGPRLYVNTNTESGLDPQAQLYDLGTDVAEANNVAAQYPAKAQEIGPLLQELRERGRTRPSQPNFIFILADDLGWRDVGCYGSPFYETPHLDRLAAQGMRFTQAYAACNVCSPTRASILTGKYPARLHLTDWLPGRPDRPDQRLLRPTLVQQLPLEEVTIAEALRQAGYRTAFIGKWHLGGTGFYPEDQGFDLNVGGCQMGHPPSYFSPYGIPTLTDGPKGEYLTDRLTDEAIRFIEEVKGRPFFLTLSHYAVHTPLQAKPGLIAKYKAKAARLPAVGAPEFLPDNGRRVRQIQSHAVYASMVEGLDDSLGRILDKLAELGLDRNTVVVFTSDNGGLSTAEGTPTSNLPLRMGKGWNYEGGIREPLLVRWPGVTRPGSTSDEPVISMDFYPTFLEMAGLPLRPDQHVDGVSLVPVLRGGTCPERPLFWHYPHYSNQGGSPSGAVRIGDFKLIEWFEDMQVELFNLREDLGERNDLAVRMPEKVASLRTQLHDWRRSVEAQMPTPNPDYRPDTGRAAYDRKEFATLQVAMDLVDD